MKRKLLSYTLVVILTMLATEAFRPFSLLQSNAQGGCRTFTETGKTVCGQFLDYWTNHGGLAQQGYPLTNEFQEVSDLNGKTYTVQYFERAVFEKHPENPPPNDVLLSQLGTFQLQRKYPGGDPSNPVSGATPTTPLQPPAPQPPAPQASQQVSGSGTNISGPVTLKQGLAVYHAIVTNVNSNFENFIVYLVDQSGKELDLVANELGGDADVSTAGRIPANGTYLFKVKSAGQWTITVTQPTGTYTTPPANQQFSGHGSQVSQLFSLKAGSARFHAVNASGDSNFIVYLVRQDGGQAALIANEIGAADVSTIENIPSNGVYLLEIKSDGDWTVTIQQ